MYSNKLGAFKFFYTTLNWTWCYQYSTFIYHRKGFYSTKNVRGNRFTIVYLYNTKSEILQSDTKITKICYLRPRDTDRKISSERNDKTSK